MALDPIWKQQLTLVTYGNEFLNQDLSFNRWINHAIFSGHRFHFRDLISQHLLAQHFHIWLEGLKKQGVRRLSLHNSSALNDEANPNPNIELLPFPHFIVSHSPDKKTAWLFGKELAEWYQADEDYKAPEAQTSPIRDEIFWRFELSTKLAKRLEIDFSQPNWDEIDTYLKSEIYNTPFALTCPQCPTLDLPYTGFNQVLNFEETTNHSAQAHQALFPTDYQADFAHCTLQQLDYLSQCIQAKIQHPYDENSVVLNPEEQLKLRQFAKHLDELMAKFITKVGNHYQSARVTPTITTENPLDTTMDMPDVLKSQKHLNHKPEKTSHKSSVFTLIVITIIICMLAYYFGL